ncbi:MAG: tryptophan--tRNA ligase [Kofleriaceae bacterium]
MSSQTQRVLTGIKPTGTPHVGNLLGAIRPALRLADQGLEAMYFIADYHALIDVKDPKKLSHMTRDVAATWLAMGLDPNKVIFYRQSDIPEILELAWIFNCFTSKGWMNKAHAYKAFVDRNRDEGKDADEDINMGLYGYPVLMAADIVAFDIDLVPVGKDQVQHVEIARDIAQRINSEHKKDILRLPQAKLEENAAIVPGIDGRKMSKSYDNTIPLFATGKELKKTINRIVTDTSPPEAPKDPDASTIFQIFKAVASPEESAALADRYRKGIGWGDAKNALYEKLESALAGPRAIYTDLMANPKRIDDLLAEGAAKARPVARKTLDRVRAAIGIG